MDGEQDGAQTQGEEQQGQQGDPQADGKQQEPKAPAQVGTPDDEEILAALAERDEKIAELERQIADAAKTVESAEALAKQIEELKAASDAERCEFELRLAGARNVTAAKALLAEHDGDVTKLKAAESWLFSAPAPQGGSTGLEPAGAAKAADKDMKRWREIAGLEDEE